MDIAWHWYWPSFGGQLLVSQDVAELFRNFRQSRIGVERGGQLFVNPSDSRGIVLALATPPHKNDRAGKTWLELDARRCREEVEVANDAGLRLIGYWHTHPQSIPVISNTDIKCFSKFSARYAQDLPQPLAIIVGNSSGPSSIKAWSFREGRYVEAIHKNWKD